MTDQSTTDPFNLQRFFDAQAGIGFTPYETALAEMRAGHKQSHWIWYVFPQIQLGTSALSEHFAIKSHDEAKAYLTNETLRNRYLEISTEVLHRLEEGVNPTFLMGGSTDRGKLISSLTLFEWAYRQSNSLFPNSQPEEILDLLDQEGFNRCESTTSWILNCDAGRAPN
ncbi:MAG: DUF1810 family protein [Ilumatobacteraceae bacterium]